MSKEDKDFDLHFEAINFAHKRHLAHKDDSGKDYFDAHLVPVFNAVQQLTPDPEVHAAAILHDVLEDTDTTYEELREKFGDRIARIVHELTHEGKKDSHGYYFPRLKSKEAILIKLVDRASNIVRMDSWDEKRKQQYLRKTKFWKSEGPQ